MTTNPQDIQGPVLLKKRQQAPDAASEQAATRTPMSSTKTVEERESEYNAARARIFASSGQRSSQTPQSTASQRPRRAVFKDRARDALDPEYRRGVAR